MGTPTDIAKIPFRRAFVAFCVLLAMTATLFTFSACSTIDVGGESTSGDPLTRQMKLSSFVASAAEGSSGAAIDTSSLSQGYVGAAATSSSKLKFQVIFGSASYNYDLSNDGTPTVVPLNMGDGDYIFRIMQNTSANRYVELFSTVAEVEMESEYEPFLRPNVYCSFDEESECVKKANELCADAQNQGDALKSIYRYIQDNIRYDSAKASSVGSDYVPDPDATLATGKGICFDYASLAAAMLRSQGIPCKVITGYVSPGNIYHAWNMIYIDGNWTSVDIKIPADTWTRIDLTFAANGAGKTIGDGSEYSDRYTY